MTRALLLLPALVGCTFVGGEDALVNGSVALCASGDVEPVGEQDQITTWTLEGTVVSDEPGNAIEGEGLSDCWDTPARTLTISDGERELRLGYGLVLEEDEVTPALDLAVGNTVEIEFVRTMVWGWDYGAVVRDDRGLIFAAQQGMATDLTSTPGAPLGRLEVRSGGPYGQAAALGCGRAQNTLAIFEGETTAEVEAGDLGEVIADAVTLNAANLGAFEYIGQMNCTDTWGPFRWAAWR